MAKFKLRSGLLWAGLVVIWLSLSSWSYYSKPHDNGCLDNPGGRCIPAANFYGWK